MSNDDFPLKPSPETIMLEEAMQRHGMPEALRNQALMRLLLADAADWSRAKFVGVIEGMTAQMSRQQDTLESMKAAMDETVAFYNDQAAGNRAALETAFGEVRRLKRARNSTFITGGVFALILTMLFRWIF